MKSSKSEKLKVKAIVRHSCLQQRSRLRYGQPTLRNARTLTQHGKRASADSIRTDESDNDEYDSDAIDSRGKDDSSDVILAFINSVLFWYRANSYFRKEKVSMMGFICPPVPSQ